MSSNVICISRALAAGGEEIGALVAERLGFRYIDNEIIIAAAERAGVSPQAVEEAERSPGLMTRIFDAFGRAPVITEGYAAWQSEAQPKYEHLIRHVVREAAVRSNAVIIAHGASIELAESEGVLRVLVTAPPEVRAQRLMSNGTLSNDEAAKAIEQSDGQRRDYLRRFYNVSSEQMTHYDIVLNTERLSDATAAELIVNAAAQD